MYKTLDLKLCYYHYVPKRVQAHIVKAMQNQCKIMSLENVQAVKTMKVSPLPLTILGKVHLEVRGRGVEEGAWVHMGRTPAAEPGPAIPHIIGMKDWLGTSMQLKHWNFLFSVSLMEKWSQCLSRLETACSSVELTQKWLSSLVSYQKEKEMCLGCPGSSVIVMILSLSLLLSKLNAMVSVCGLCYTDSLKFLNELEHAEFL